MRLRVKSQEVNQLIHVKNQSHLGADLRVRSESNQVPKEYCITGGAISATISSVLLAEMMATRNAVFIDRCESKKVAIGSKGGLVRLLTTKFKSHVGMGCVGWEKRFIMPLGVYVCSWV